MRWKPLVTLVPMNPRFEFGTATRIIFGRGVVGELGPYVKEAGRRALVVIGRSARRADALLATLRGQGVDGVTFSVPGEPEIQTVRDGVALAKREAVRFRHRFWRRQRA